MAAERTDESLGMTPLYQEHLLLGAAFGPGHAVLRYEGESADLDGRMSCLTDITHVPLLLLSGNPAPSYACSVFAGKNLEIGRCAFEAVLTGDGALTSIALLARTGTQEYVVIDASLRSEVLEGWLSFVAGIKQGGTVPFAGLATEDVTGSHAVLALSGAAAPSVLADYLHGQRMPKAGEVAALNLDRLPCIVLHAPKPLDDLYLILVPPTHARVLWRSLLSFKEVQPLGTEAFDAMLCTKAPWYGLLRQSGTLRLTYDELVGFGLVRETSDFVGARGLGL